MGSCDNKRQLAVGDSTPVPAAVLSTNGLAYVVGSAAGVTNLYAYDALGRRIAETDGRGNTTRTAYDAFGRVASVTDAAGFATSFAYDALGRQVASTDPLGNATHTAYDNEGRTIAQWGATYPVVYAYDAFGDLATLTTFRDASAPLSPELGDTTRWLRDAATGLVTKQQMSAKPKAKTQGDREFEAVRKHGARSGIPRRSGNVYADGLGPSYTYTPDGKLATRTWARGVTTYYSYNANRSLTNVVYSDNTPSIAYAYDNRGNIVSATVDGVSTNLYAYDVFGNITNEVQNGTVISRDYDVFGRPTGYALGGFAPSREVHYAYDPLGRFASVTAGGSGDVPRPLQTFTYTYLPGTALVTGYTCGDFSRSVSYEPNYGVATTSYALGAGDRLASWTGGAYSYDAAGCVTRIERDGRPTLDLAWNGQYQLVSVSTNGAFAEGYAYDALGRRVSTTTAEGTLRHVYDDRWQVVADIDAHGGVVASYVWGEGIDSLLAVKVGGASYYPLTDIQGTVWGYADAANNIVARWTYDAWGNVLDEEVAVPALATLRYRFQGREWSAATGLVNFRMRWYDPETGRWLSKDPIGLSGGLNQYCFCMDAPILYVDPTGELSPAVAVGVGIGVAYLGYIIYRHFNKVKQKMDSADIDDLRDVANKMIDCTEDTMATVTPLFGPPMPDTTLPLTDKATEVLVRPLWRRVFDQIRPSE